MVVVGLHLPRMMMWQHLCCVQSLILIAARYLRAILRPATLERGMGSAGVCVKGVVTKSSVVYSLLCTCTKKKEVPVRSGNRMSIAVP